jgi:hypothetical protein
MNIRTICKSDELKIKLKRYKVKLAESKEAGKLLQADVVIGNSPPFYEVIKSNRLVCRTSIFKEAVKSYNSEL